MTTQNDLENLGITIAERGKNYGDYTGGTKLRNNILNLLNERHEHIHGVPIKPLMLVAIGDIVHKLARIAATPDHIDSWHDIQGYANLIETMLKEDNNHACNR